MKSAVPNPHPEHMFNILWAQAEQSTETQLRIREGERERERERAVKWKYGWASEKDRNRAIKQWIRQRQSEEEEAHGESFAEALMLRADIVTARSRRAWMWGPCGFESLWNSLHLDPKRRGCERGWMLGSMWACDVYLLPHQDGSSGTDPDCGVVAPGCSLPLGWSVNVMRTRRAAHLAGDRSARCLCWHLSPWIHAATGRVRMLGSDLHAQMSRWWDLFVCTCLCVRIH